MIALETWPLGIALYDPGHAGARIYFRFYEWHLFDAGPTPGDHTPGKDDWEWSVSSDGSAASVHSAWLDLDVRAAADGAELALSIANPSGHPWPSIAALIPCLGAEYEREGVPAAASFFDDGHTRTLFVGPQGLEPLQDREIHYAAPLKNAVLARSARGDGRFERFSLKWPHSDRDAHAGLLLRESVDGRWVTGVAWERYLSAQGHNPRRCMHLSVRAGPLAPGERREIRGKLYLFAGTGQDCLARYRQDFAGILTPS